MFAQTNSCIAEILLQNTPFSLTEAKKKGDTKNNPNSATYTKQETNIWNDNLSFDFICGCI